MRRSTTLAVVVGTAVLVTGAAGFTVAQATANRVPGAAFELAVAAKSSSLPAQGPSTEPPSVVSAAAQTVILVTVPDLTTPPATDPAAPIPAAPIPAPLVVAETPSSTAPTTEPPAAAPPAAAPEPAPAPAPAAEPAPAPPVDAPLAPPYTAVLGWTGEGRVAYLTFDDGPGPYTGRVLDILAASGVKATFCQLGSRVAENPDLARRVVAEGHTVCNHSWDHHSPFDALSREALDQQLGSTQDAIATVTGHSPRYFRAPQGRFGEPGGAVLQAAQRARTIPLGWAVDSDDWRKPGAATITSNVLTAVTPGAVILLHDGGGADRQQTVEALPGIISGLQAAGYTVAPLPQPAG